MARQILNNGETGYNIRKKINDNFNENYQAIEANTAKIGFVEAPLDGNKHSRQNGAWVVLNDGLDGYTPQKGVDYFDGTNGQDGYTPIKDIDYFDGQDGTIGINGKSAYEIALDGGFVGTESQWLQSLYGTNGQDGYTPQKGIDYFDGQDGYTPIKGIDYFDGVKGDTGEQGIQGPVDTTFTNSQNMTTIEHISNTYTLDLALTKSKKFRIVPIDTTAKTIVLSNKPTGATFMEIGLLITYTAACAVTMPTGFVVYGGGTLPTALAGESYWYLLESIDSGATGVIHYKRRK